MRNYIKTYRSFLRRIKFRNFMHPIISLFLIMIAIGICKEIAELVIDQVQIYFALIKIVFLFTILPVFMYWNLRITQWIMSKIGFEYLYTVLIEK